MHMHEFHIPTVVEIMTRQYQDTGQIDEIVLDLILEYWGIDLAAFNAPETAKELWRHLIILLLIDPDGFEEIRAFAKYKLSRCKSPASAEIPDIVA